MHEYQVKQELLEADRRVSQKTRETKRDEMVRAANALGKDPLIKELLEKGVPEESIVFLTQSETEAKTIHLQSEIPFL